MSPTSPLSSHGESAVGLGELRKYLDKLRVDYDYLGRTSLREIARRTPGRISHTTVGEVLRCDKVPQWDTLKNVVIALGGNVQTAHALHAAAIRSERPEVPAPASVPHIQVAAEAWLSILEREGVSEGLLRGRPAAEVTPGLAALDEFLTRSLPGIRVEIKAGFQPRTFGVDSVREFWIMMLVDSILHGPDGLRRWLLSNTDAVLHKERAYAPHVSEVWQWMFDTYLTSAADLGLFERFVDDAITGSGDDHNRLYRTIAFLLGVAKDDPMSVRHIGEALEKHDSYLRSAGGSPALLGKVRVLIAETDRALHGNLPGVLRFRHDLVSFPASRLCPYEFRAMRYPLTIGDVDAILGRPLSSNAAKPFVLAQDRTNGTAFGGLWKELTDVVNSVPRYAEGEIWRWDIPTVAEWLTLSGCLDQPYPWGQDPPTPAHANLKFDVSSHLRPVGTFVAGRSPAGVYDCCGGVNEIVREFRHEMFDSDLQFEGAFRLAGGSYRSPPQGVNCQRFRHLTPRHRGRNPSTVGIRLVVYRESDEETRWEAQTRFRRLRQTSVLADA